MKLFKFVSLEKFDHIEQIFQLKTFYLANWRALNDPMEGFYTSIINDSTIDFNTLINNFYSEKISLRVCSFSKTLRSILLWSHYANQHKGMAIEVFVPNELIRNLHKVNYVLRVPELFLELNPSPLSVLTSKIKIWEYEREYRYIANQERAPIGRITGIFFGLRTSIADKLRVSRLTNNSLPMYETEIDFYSNKIKVAGHFMPDKL